jgi:hypothetical protein
MQPRDISNRSGAKLAERLAVTGNDPAVQLPLAIVALAPPAVTSVECGSARIRQAVEILRDLLLDDGDDVLIGVVAARLDAMTCELEQLAGTQRLFELWVKDAP